MTEWSEPVQATKAPPPTAPMSDWSSPVSADEAKKFSKKPTDGQITGPTDAREIITDVPGDAAKLLGGVSHYVSGSLDAGKKIIPEQVKKQQTQFDQLRGRLPRTMADYDQGLPWGVRANLSAADPVAGDKERRLVIEKYMPGAQVQYDKSGRMLVKPQGATKFIPVDGGGFWSGFSADLVGNALPVAGGAAALALAGPELLAAGAVGGTALAIASLFGGGFAGKSVDEIRKGLSGLWDKSSASEELKTLNRAGEQSVVGELTGRAIGALGKGVSKYPKTFGGQTAESEALTEEMLKKGYRPSLGVAAPEATRPPYVQKTIEKMTTSIRESHNAEALEKDVRSTLGSIGFSRDEQDEVLNQILSGRVDAREYGDTIAKKARDYVTTSEKAMSDARDATRTKVDGDLEKLQGSIGDADAGLLTRIQDEISDGRTKVSNTYRPQYEGIWKLSGETANYPTSSVTKVARDLLEKLPPTEALEVSTADPELMKTLGPTFRASVEALKAKGVQDTGERVFIGKNRELLGELMKIARLAPEITPQQAHTLRSQLLALERDSDFTKNFAGYSRGQLSNALETGFDELEKKVPGFTTQLREINAGYRQDIAKFDNATVKTIMRDARLNGSVAPEKVLEFVKNPNNMREILDVVGPETKQKIAATDFAQALRAASDPQTGIIDGRAFAKQIKDRDAMGPTLYGRRFSDMKKLADKFAALDGQFDPSKIGKVDADFVGQMENIVRSEDELQKSMAASGGWLKALGKEGVLGERAIKMTVAPGAESRTLEAAKFYKKDSPEMSAARRYALVKLFSDAADGESNSISDAIMGGKLKEAWGKWTPKQKEVLFGDMVPEIDGLVRRVNALKPKGSGTEIAGGLAAGAVNLGGIATYPITALAMLGDYLFASPTGIRWFAGTLGMNAREWAEGEAERTVLGKAQQAAMRTVLNGTGPAVQIISQTEAQAKKDYRQ